MSGYVRTLQKKMMDKRGYQREYMIKDGKIVKKPYPRFLPKVENASA